MTCSPSRERFRAMNFTWVRPTLPPRLRTLWSCSRIVSRKPVRRFMRGPCPSARGETAQMVHVFQNILSNALKYRNKTSPPEIHVSAERRRRQWLISIRDNGIGFEPRYSERIFGLFKRLHKEDYPGTGLGLAICKRIVERYGGRMWAEGRPGEGATFYFTLPRLDAK